MSVHILSHDFVLQQVDLPVLELKKLSEEVLQVTFVLGLKYLAEVLELLRLFLAEKGEKTFGEDVRKHLRKVHAKDSKVVYILICKPNVTCPDHQLNDSEDF